MCLRAFVDLLVEAHQKVSVTRKCQRMNSPNNSNEICMYICLSVFVRVMWIFKVWCFFLLISECAAIYGTITVLYAASLMKNDMYLLLILHKECTQEFLPKGNLKHSTSVCHYFVS